MAQTVAFTSGAIAPKVAQVDSVHLDSALPLNVQIYGDATDPTDAGAVFTWKWYLLDKPAGSAITFIDPDTSQNPRVGPVDIWGNYLYMLVATSGSAGGASESNVLKAPTTAFVQVRIQSAGKTLERPAKWARRWTELYRTFITAFKEHVIGDHQDVAVATGPKLDMLCNGSLAENPPGVPMHTHGTNAISPATTVALGAVVLQDTPVNPALPAVLNRRDVHAHGYAEGSVTDIGYIPGQIVTQAGAVPNPHILMLVDEGCKLESVSLCLADGGAGAGTYNFSVYIGSEAEWAAGVPTAVPALAISGASTAHAPWFGSAAVAGGVAHAGRAYVGIVCTAYPATPGSRLSALVFARQAL